MSLVWWIKQLLLIGFGGFLVAMILKIDMPPVFKNVIIALAVLGLVLWLIKVVLPLLN